MFGSGKKGLLDRLTPDKAFNKFERELLGDNGQSTPMKNLKRLREKLDSVDERDLRLFRAYVAAIKHKNKVIPIGGFGLVLFYHVLGVPALPATIPFYKWISIGIPTFLLLLLLYTLLRVLRSMTGLHLLQSVMGLRLAEFDDMAPNNGSDPRAGQTKDQS